ncbi:MAG: FecR domain-containing protein [Burkholderiales bacterium]|nr:FecR domain-containing protein [Burkholderiales bacterium]
MSLAVWADVGRIEAGEGDIRVIGDDGTVKASAVGAGLAGGDSVSTAGDQSWAILRMEDGASFTLRPNTRLHIDKYQYDESNPSNSKSWLNLVKGSLRAITGLIGRQSPSSYALHTPTATIGVRGTDHETTVIDEEQATAHVQAGTYDTVNDGETVMHNEHGDVSIKPGKVGFLQHGGTSAPRMLNYRPAFFDRYRNFDRGHGIVDVLGRIHKSVGNGAFTAHPDLKERLKNEMSRPPEWHKPQAGMRPVQHGAAAGNGQHPWQQQAMQQKARQQRTQQRAGGANEARRAAQVAQARKMANAGKEPADKVGQNYKKRQRKRRKGEKE